MSEFAVTAFPTSYLIGPDGKIILKEIGFDPNEKGEIEKNWKKFLARNCKVERRAFALLAFYPYLAT